MGENNKNKGLYEQLLDVVDSMIIEAYTIHHPPTKIFRCLSCGFEFPYIEENTSLDCPVCGRQEVSFKEDVQRKPVTDAEKIKKIANKIIQKVNGWIKSGKIEDSFLGIINISRILATIADECVGDNVINFAKLNTLEIVDIPYPYHNNLIRDDAGLSLLKDIVRGEIGFVICKGCGCPQSAETFFIRLFNGGDACFICGSNEFIENFWLEDLL